MSLQSLNLRRILVSTAILSQLTFYILSWAGMIVDPYMRTGSDFMGFYSFGWIAERRGFDQIYSLDEQQRLQEQIVGHPVTPIFHTHLPLTAPLSMAVGDADYVASFKRWALVLLLLNAVNVYLMLRLLDLQKFNRQNILILAAGAYLFDPTFSGLMNGQDTAIVLLGAALFATGFFSRRDLVAGLGLSLVTLRPQTALFLAIPFFFRRPRVLWGFALGSAVLAVISLGLLRLDGTLEFLDAIRYIEGTVWHEAHALDMPTISGIIRRNFALVDTGPAKTFVWLAYGTGIAGFCVLWHRSSEIDERHVGLLFTAGLFLLPYAHYHDLILLLIPIFCVLRMYQRETRVLQDRLALLPLVLSWVLTLGFAGSGSFKFPFVYLVMLSLVYLLWFAPRQRWTKVREPANGSGSRR